MEMIRRGVRIMGMSLLATLVAVAWGCGGDDAGTTATSSRAEFVEAAEEICKRGLQAKDEVLQAAFKEGEGHDYTAAQAKEKREELVEDMLPHYQEIATGLAELPTPAGDNSKIEDIVSNMELAIAKGKADPISLVETNLFDKSDAAARAYGLESCGAL